MPIRLKHLSKNIRYCSERLGLEVNRAQQMPISCSSLPLCLLSCYSRDKRWDKRMQHLSQHLSRQQYYKKKKNWGCRTSKELVMWGKLIEVWACEGFLSFYSSLSMLLIKDNTACWYTQTFFSPNLLWELGCPQSREGSELPNNNVWCWQGCTTTLK